MHAGVTFNSGTPVALTNCATSFDDKFTSSTVSDSLGNLLFYAGIWLGAENSGGVICNRNHVRMPNGYFLFTGWQTIQNYLAVQIPGSQTQYLVFTMDEELLPPRYLTPHGLTYSVVDMTLDGGLGDVPAGEQSIGVPGAAQTGAILTGTRHRNNRDVWITVRDYINNTYLTYLVNSSGLVTVPIVVNSSVHLLFTPGEYVPGMMMKFSQDGTKAVCLIKDTLEYCQFNASTGVLNPMFKIKIGNGNCPSAEFSVDSHYLYLHWYYYLYQYDATKTDSLQFIQSKIQIDNHLTNEGLMQLGPDNKIYLVYPRGDKDTLGVIQNPEIQGLGCNFIKSAVPLGGLQSSYGLPQFVQRYYAIIHYPDDLCSHAPVTFTSSIWPQPDTIRWNFDDPLSGPANFSTLPNPLHTYSNAGTYTVELYVRHIDNRTDTTRRTLTIYPTPQPNLGTDQTICTGDLVTFDAGSGTGSAYLWKDLISGLPVGTAQTFTTGQAGTYEVAVTSQNGCIGRDTVQLSTTSVPALANNPPLVKTICTGESTNISLTSIPPGAMFHWTATLSTGSVTGFSADSGLVINQVLLNSLATPGIVTYHITPKIGSCSGSAVDFPVTVNPGDSVKVSISASVNNICSGTSVTFTATPTSGGSSPSYQWKVNGVDAGTNSSVFTYPPVNNDIVNCILTTSNTICVFNNPATSNFVTMIVNPMQPVSVTITSSFNPICAGTPVLFTAHPVNEGSSPVYEWKVNGVNAGTNSSTFTCIPVNNDQVSCVMTSSLTVCVTNNPATSNTVIMQVDQNHPVSLTVSASPNPVCAGNTVLFTALPVNEGLSPGYQWKVNGVNAGTNSSTFTCIPVNNDKVSCVMTSSLTTCVTNNPATSNVVTMTVNPNYTVSVTISASSDTVCQGTSVMCTAYPVNEGSTPFYQWKVNGVNAGTNLSTFTWIPVNHDVVSCVLTSSYTACTTNNPATSNTVTMNVINNLATGVSITAVPNPFCSGSTVSCSAFPTNGGITPSYQWKVNWVNAGTNATTYSYIPLQGDIVQCVMNSSLSCITNNPVSSNTIVMNALAAPSVSFTLCFDSITTINSAAFVLKGGLPLGGTYSGPGVNSGTGVFTPSLAGVGTKTITYAYTNTYSCSALMTRNIIVQAAPIFSCGNNLTDIRDNKVYPTIQIGTQCWMRKNLNYGKTIYSGTAQTDNCLNEKYCYNDNAANCTLYGGLYQWDELMAYNTTPGSQGLCPPGWHVPTQAEWMTLFNASITQGLAGKPLQDSIINGFRAIESGFVYSNMTWKYQGFATFFWSSDSFGIIKALSHGMNRQNFSVSDYYSNRSNAFAGRCLKD